MILIFSENFEPTTNEVIDWIISYDKSFVRVNNDDDQSVNYRVFQDETGITLHFFYRGKQLNIKDIESFWYRRGGFPKLKVDCSSLHSNEILSKNIEKIIKEEEYALRHYFYRHLDNNVKKLGSAYTGTMNKLMVLEIANSFGIRTPRTMVTSQKRDLLKFIKISKSGIITKAIHEGALFYDSSGSGYISYVEELSEKTIENALPEKFQESKFQEKIDKWIELRVFYIDQQFYSMAIFSQLDKQTSVDFRIYNEEKPNRTVPFNLPEKEKVKFQKLMDELKLETGSIDVVVSKNLEYHLLEVNPVGQLGMTSKPCNFYLEKKIAKYLINGENKN